MRTLCRLSSLILAPCLVSCAQAQQPQSALASNSPSLTASVSGSVTDATTHLPVHFGEICLIPRPPDPPGNLTGNLMPNPSQIAEHKKAADLQTIRGLVGLDGSFRLDGVPIGDYLISALKAGYVTPGASTDVDASDDDLKMLYQSLPVVHVAEGQVAKVNLILRRGGVIAGRILFADGSPMIGQPVVWELSESVSSRSNPLGKTVSEKLSSALSITGYEARHHPEIRTDDKGQYRLFGLPPGRYVVSTLLLLSQNSGVQLTYSNGSGSHSGGKAHIYPEIIPVFGPGVFSRKHARNFVIHADEQILDADFKIDFAGLHTLTGRVLAAQDRHAPNAVMVRLRERDAEDNGRFAESEENGVFQFHHLPPGSYAIEIIANDLTPPDQGRPPKPYKTVKRTVAVTDQDVVLGDVLMEALKPGENNDDQ